MQFNKVQGDFMAFLYTLRPPGDLHRRVRALFNGPDTPDPEKGLNTYRRNLVFGLIGALKETYPFCAALLGEGNFNYFCREYIYQNHSRNPDLMQYGEGFADFLSERPESKDWPFMSDVARLEWARDRVFYAAPGFDQKPVSHFSGMRIQTSNTLRLVKTSYGIHKPWSQFVDDGIEAIEEQPFKPGEEYLAVWSRDGIPAVEAVDSSLGKLLENLEKGIYPENGNKAGLQDELEHLFWRGWAQG